MPRADRAEAVQALEAVLDKTPWAAVCPSARRRFSAQHSQLERFALSIFAGCARSQRNAARLGGRG